MESSKLLSHIYTNLVGTNTSIKFDTKPDKCPECHNNIDPIYLFGKELELEIAVTFQCTNSLCKKVFLGFYEKGHQTIDRHDLVKFKRTSIGSILKMAFPEEVDGISPMFIIIYNQAKHAEDILLDQIAGVGYRKAIEYLIKDYLIQKNPDKKDEIESKFLGKCIKEYNLGENIKNCAERAVWLGNDETHYVRKWEEKTIDDMKKLIDLTVHWIVQEVKTKHYLNEMQ